MGQGLDVFLAFCRRGPFEPMADIVGTAGSLVVLDQPGRPGPSAVASLVVAIIAVFSLCFLCRAVSARAKGCARLTGKWNSNLRYSQFEGDIVANCLLTETLTTMEYRMSETATEERATNRASAPVTPSLWSSPSIECGTSAKDQSIKSTSASGSLAVNNKFSKPDLKLRYSFISCSVSPSGNIALNASFSVQLVTLKCEVHCAQDTKAKQLDELGSKLTLLVTGWGGCLLAVNAFLHTPWPRGIGPVGRRIGTLLS
jgi:hypothetical protein